MTLCPLLPARPGFPGSITRISCGFHFFRAGGLKSGRLQSSSGLRCHKRGRFEGRFFGFGCCFFSSFPSPLLLESSLPRFALFAPCCHQLLIDRRLSLKLIQSLLFGLVGGCYTVLK